MSITGVGFKYQKCSKILILPYKITDCRSKHSLGWCTFKLSRYILLDRSNLIYPRRVAYRLTYFQSIFRLIFQRSGSSFQLAALFAEIPERNIKGGRPWGGGGQSLSTPHHSYWIRHPAYKMVRCIRMQQIWLTMLGT